MHILTYIPRMKYLVIKSKQASSSSCGPRCTVALQPELGRNISTRSRRKQLGVPTLGEVATLGHVDSSRHAGKCIRTLEIHVVIDLYFDLYLSLQKCLEKDRFCLY